MILGAEKGPESLRRSPLFRLFSDLGGYFVCSVAILGQFSGFCCFGNNFWMIWEEFLGRKQYKVRLSDEIRALCGEICEDMTRGDDNLYWIYPVNAGA